MNENKLSFFRGLFNGLLITFLIFLLCFGCFMCGFNFHKQHTDLIYQSLSVNPQDTVVDNPFFNGSVIGVPYTVYDSHSVNEIHAYEIGYVPIKIDFSSSYVHFITPSYSLNGNLGNSWEYTWNNISFETGLNVWVDGVANSNYSVFVGIYVDSSFNFNPVKINLYSEAAQGLNCYLSVIEYRDINNQMLRFHIAFRASDIPYTDWNMPYRSYFLNNPSSFTDNEIYNAGLSYGRAEGLADNQQNIYDSGLKLGKELGSALGYQHGVEDAGEYTFLGLLGAVVDAPVQTFIGLLNFEILGFNFLSFLTAILTIGLIFFIIRFVFFRS